MSYDITGKVHAARARADLAAQEASRDLRRGNFLRALDESEFEVSEWEAQFIESFLNFTGSRPGAESCWWTPGRRTSCDKMMSHYGPVALKVL